MNWLQNQITTIYTNYKKYLPETAVFIGITFVYISFLLAIGPEYDELLGVNAGLNCPSNIFVEKIVWFKTQCFPVMLSPYIGGIVGIFYRVLFILAPINLLSFRLFNVFILLISLLLLYKSVQNIFSKNVALLSLFFLGFDFQLWKNIRFEGSSPVPFFLKSLFIALAIYALDKKKPVLYFLTGVVLALSIWAKFDVIFFYASLGISFILINHKRFKEYKKQIFSYKNAYISFIAGLTVGIIPFAYYLLRNYTRFVTVGSSIGRTDFSVILLNKIQLFFYQFSSFDGIYYIYREVVSIPLVITVVTALFWIILFFSIKESIKSSKFKYLGYSFIVFFFFFMLYGGLSAPHHRSLIYPVPQVLLSLYVVKKNFVTKGIGISLFILITSFSFYKTFQYSQTIGSVGAYSTNIYPLSDYLNSLEEGNILVGDWGIATQLVLLSNTPQNITEVSFQFNWQDISSVTQESFDLVQNCNYIVLHSEENVIFKNANKNLRSLNLGSLIYTDSVFEVFECKN